MLINQNNFIYYWDYSGYWKQSISYSYTLFESPILSCIKLIASINFSDYGHFIAFLLALPLYIFGRDFSIYVTFVFSLFAIPFALLLTGFTSYLSKQNMNKFIPPIFLMILFFPVLIFPILNGYADAFCLIPLLSAFGLLFQTNFFSIKNKYKSIALSICLLLCLIGRRYFSFAVLAFGLSLVTTNCVYWIHRYKGRSIKNASIKKDIRNFFYNMFIVGGFLIFFLLTIFIGFTLRSIQGNFTTAYNAYQSDSIFLSLYSIFKVFGAIPIILFVVGTIFSIITKQYRRIYLFLILYLISGIFLFTKIQSFDQHHFYILIPAFLLGCSISLVFFKNLSTKLFYLMMILLLLNSIQLFLPISKTILFSNESYSVQVRTDISTLQNLVDDLNDFSQTKDSIYCLSSDSILNEDTLKNINLPNTLNAVPGLCNTSDIDLRDGFPKTFFTAEYIILPKDVTSNQKVISILQEDLLSDTPLSTCYEMISTYTIENQREIFLFQRITEIPLETREFVVNQYNDFYPENKELFQNRILALTTTPDPYEKISEKIDKILKPIYEFVVT